MKSIVLVFFVFLLIDAAPEPENRKSLRFQSSKRRRITNEDRINHKKQRTIHRNYVPDYPDQPIWENVKIDEEYYLVVWESGSDMLWVLDESYPGRGVNQSFYDPKKSSNAKYVGNFSAFSGDLQVKGDMYEDLVDILDIESATIQRFGVVKSIYETKTKTWNPKIGMNGVCGLAWNPAEKDNVTAASAPLLNTMSSHDFSGPRYFSEFIEAQENPRRYITASEIGSPIVARLCDPEMVTAPLTYHTKTRSLTFQVDSFSYNEQKFDGGVAKFDTGVPTIDFSQDTFNSLFAAIQPDYDWALGVYTVPCSQAGKLPEFVFTVSKKKLSVPSSFYVADLSLGDENCALNIDVTDEVTIPFILGIPFHLAYCFNLDLDNTKIGFTKSLHWT